MTGGTFTITNGGVFGSMLSTPIINPPQSAILGMHNIVERPVVEHGEVVVRPIMYVALSYDLLVETEEDPRIGSKNQLGVDQYGVGLHYQWDQKLKTVIKGAYVRTNQDGEGLNILGSVTWTL